ncbi:hypothetical protein M3Y99_00210100 [Aphelenchoides fujianensis]|nr:hypothetical protein M3Y99_00210100 [Aphelenchoides fujianensis]
MSWWPSSMKLDQEVVLGTANYVQRLKMYPHFDLANYILMICHVREDLGANSTIFSRRHPLSCWVSSIVVCFAGNFLANFLLGEPIIAAFKKHDDLLMATVVWYLVFYSPFDLFYKTTKLFPVNIVLSILKEVQRTYKIHHGVNHAVKLYPNAYVIHVIVGTAKGAGSGIIRVFEQLIRGTWSPQHNEILRPSFTTKACVIAAVLFTMDRHAIYINLPHEITYLGAAIFFVYFKLNEILFHVNDPLAPLENLASAVFLGGVWDALSRAIVTSRERAANKVENGSLAAGVEKKDQYRKKRPLIKRNARRPFLLRNLERGWNGWTKTEKKAHEYALSRTQSTSALHDARSPTPEAEFPKISGRSVVTFPASDNGETETNDGADSDVENRSNPLPVSPPTNSRRSPRTPAVEGLKRWRDVALNLSPIDGPSTSASQPNGRRNPRVFQSTPNPAALKRPLKRSSQPLLSPERPPKKHANDRRFR